MILCFWWESQIWTLLTPSVLVFVDKLWFLGWINQKHYSHSTILTLLTFLIIHGKNFFESFYTKMQTNPLNYWMDAIDNDSDRHFVWGQILSILSQKICWHHVEMFHCDQLKLNLKLHMDGCWLMSACVCVCPLYFSMFGLVFQVMSVAYFKKSGIMDSMKSSDAYFDLFISNFRTTGRNGDVNIGRLAEWELFWVTVDEKAIFEHSGKSDAHFQSFLMQWLRAICMWCISKLSALA